MALALATCSALTLAAGCSDPSTPSAGDAGTDTGMPVDTAMPIDTGMPTDMGMGADAGSDAAVTAPPCDAIVLAPEANFSIQSGGTATLDVIVTRGSATGTLTVSASDADGRLTASPVVVGAGDDTATLSFTATQSAVNLAGALSISVDGACTGADTVNYNLGGSGDLTFSVATSAKSISRDTSDFVMVSIDRLAGFGGRTVTISATGLPAGVTVTPVMLSGIDSTAMLEFVVSASATLGTFEVTLRAEATLDDAPILRTAMLSLTVAGLPAFTLGADRTTATVVQGASTNLTLDVTRDAAFTSALSTSVDGLPPGVSATGGAFGASDTSSTLTLDAIPTARLLVPFAATVRTTDGDVSRTRALEVVVHPSPDAQRDAAFGVDGVVVGAPYVDGSDAPQVAIPTASNQIFVYSSSGVRRWNEDGTVDSSFPATAFPTSAYPRAVGADASTEEVFGATTWSATEIQVGKFTANGTVDTNFGVMGRATVPVPGVNLDVGMVAAAGGKVYVGIWGTNTTGDVIVVRLDAATGALDTSFDGDGVYVFDTGVYDSVASVTPLADGGVLLVVQSPSMTPNAVETRVVRLDANGAPVTAFDGDGVVSLAAVSPLAFGDVFLRGDVLDLLGAGYDSSVPRFYNEVARLSLATGALDASFGSGGILEIDGLGQVFDAHVEPTRTVLCGRAIDGSDFNAGFYVARLTSDWAYDATFGGGAHVVRGGTDPGYMQACGALALASDGDYLGFGLFQPNTAVVRYEP